MRCAAFSASSGTTCVPDLGSDVYNLLYRLLGTQPEAHEKRRKPPWCEDGPPPVTDDQVIDTLTRRTREVLGRGGR